MNTVTVTFYIDGTDPKFFRCEIAREEEEGAAIPNEDVAGIIQSIAEYLQEKMLGNLRVASHVTKELTEEAY